MHVSKAQGAGFPKTQDGTPSGNEGWGVEGRGARSGGEEDELPKEVKGRGHQAAGVQ